jgi:hypothetical protein
MDKTLFFRNLATNSPKDILGFPKEDRKGGVCKNLGFALAKVVLRTKRVVRPLWGTLTFGGAAKTKFLHREGLGINF